MGEHGRAGSEIIDSNGDQKINLSGIIDVDILMGIERERSQISDWKNREHGRMTMTVKLELGIRGGNGKWERQHWTGSRN